ncbi:MAG: tetraacyldisaccharide 4'-kinase [Rhodospirillaceae bacterium]|nr:tetraacyldisaccharide 4'-kinase [Rhodospirillaceae bacterium]
MRAPDFWTEDVGLARLLEPFGRIYGAITTARASRTNVAHAPVPVISVGGLTVGGAGKTPVAMALVGRLKAKGERPAVVLRGYGGTLKGPVRVDTALHTVTDVGDEALLHAAQCPTWVARKRILGARAAAESGATVVLLDDGHQTPGIHKDMRIVVIDGTNPFGNGYIFPAGPLRENPNDALGRADAVVLMGEDNENLLPRLPKEVLQLRADFIPDQAAGALNGRAVVAFAGIARPEKFLATLQSVGAHIASRHWFEDHEPFGPADIQPILDEAFAINAIPVTTAKDAVRLTPDQRQQVNVVSVAVKWRDEAAVDRLLARVCPPR